MKIVKIILSAERGIDKPKRFGAPMQPALTTAPDLKIPPKEKIEYLDSQVEIEDQRRSIKYNNTLAKTKTY